MKLGKFNKKVRKYLPLIGIISLILAILAITGFTFDIPNWINSLSDRNLIWFLFSVNFAFTLIILIIALSNKKR